LPIRLPRLAVHAGGGVSLEGEIGRAQADRSVR
jgi:hypothetical protein